MEFQEFHKCAAETLPEDCKFKKKKKKRRVSHETIALQFVWCEVSLFGMIVPAEWLRKYWLSLLIQWLKGIVLTG